MQARAHFSAKNVHLFAYTNYFSYFCNRFENLCYETIRYKSGFGTQRALLFCGIAGSNVARYKWQKRECSNIVAKRETGHHFLLCYMV